MRALITAALLALATPAMAVTATAVQGWQIYDGTIEFVDLSTAVRNSISASSTAVALATTTLAARATALEVWQGTTSPRVAAHDIFMSTTGPLVDAHQVWMGTASPVIDSLQVWKGTASPVIDSLQVWKGTISVEIANLSLSTANLASGGATTYVTVTGDTMTGPLLSPVFHVIDGGYVASAGAALSIFHTGGHAYINSYTAGGGALAPVSILGSNVNIGPGAGGTNFQIGPTGDVNSKSVTLSGGITAATGTFTEGITTVDATISDELTFTGSDGHIHGNNLHIHASTNDGADTSSTTVTGGGNHDANHFIRGGTMRVYGNEADNNPGDAILQAGTVTDGEVRLMANGSNGLVLAQDLNVTIAQGLTVATFTATVYSSATVVYNSSGSLTQDFMEWYAKDGYRMMLIDGAGSVRGLRINPGTFSTSGTADLDVFGYNGGSPLMQFRRNDTTVLAHDNLAMIAARDHDTSTGGSGEKASWRISAGDTDWTSNSPMEQWQIWQLSRLGGTPADFMVLTTTGLLVVGWPGVPEETQSSCSTCTLQVISNTAGHGVDVVGTLAVSGNARMSTADLSGHLSASSATFTRDGDTAVKVISQTGSGQVASLILQRGTYITDVYTDYAMRATGGDFDISRYRSGSSDDLIHYDDGDGNLSTWKPLVVNSIYTAACTTCAITAYGGISAIGGSIQTDRDFVLGAGGTFYTTVTQTETGWSGTSGGTITYSGAIVRSNLVDTPIISTFIPCAVGVASITLNIANDYLQPGETWEIEAKLYQVSASTGNFSFVFNNITSAIYQQQSNVASEIGPFLNTGADRCYLTSATSTRFYLEQNGWMKFRMNISSSRIQEDKIAAYWDMNTEESGAGSGAINPGFGGCEMNGAGASDPIIQQITIQEIPSTVGQGLFCGDISLYRKRK